MSRFAPLTTANDELGWLGAEYQHAASTTWNYAEKFKPGLSEQTVRRLSALKNEPRWMLEKRLEGYRAFNSRPNPSWGADLSAINWDDISYYLKPLAHSTRDWNEVPIALQETFERIGVPQAERDYLAGVKMQFDSEVFYGSLKNEWADQGVIFLSMDEGLAQFPDLVRQYFGTVIPAGDNKLAALNTAAWSGGSFIYVPPGIKVAAPLQTYFRMNAPQAGQFERTLIIVDENAEVEYQEGCTAPAWSQSSLHAAVVEIIVKPGARCHYITIQNWFHTVYNLVTKRARVEAAGHMIWTDCNLGSKVTMKYPSVLLVGPEARGEVMSLAIATSGQHQDTGAKMIHLAPHTKSLVTAKSISRGSGRNSYRGLVSISPAATDSQSKVVCDALLIDPESRTDTYPTNRIMTSQSQVEHEATTHRIGEEQLFSLMSKGISEEEASALIVRGFAEPVIRQLPLEYALELNKLVTIDMSGSVG